MAKSEIIYAKITETIPFIMTRNKAYKYLPITTSDFLRGKIPYSLLRLFFSYTEKYVPIKGAVITKTIATVKTGIFVIIPIMIAIASVSYTHLTLPTTPYV